LFSAHRNPLSAGGWRIYRNVQKRYSTIGLHSEKAQIQKLIEVLTSMTIFRLYGSPFYMMKMAIG
jgi:hypothetical protein